MGWRVPTATRCLMLRLAFRGAWAGRAVVASAFVAVLLGVGFISAVLVLADTFGAQARRMAESAYAGSDLVVQAGEPAEPTGAPEDRTLDQSLVGALGTLPGVVETAGFTEVSAALLGERGEPVAASRHLPRPLAGSWIGSDLLNPFEIAEGAPPAAPDEVVVDRRSAERAGIGPGDRVPVRLPDGAVEMTVSGVATFGSAGSPGGIGVVLFAPGRARELSGAPGRVDQIHVALEAGAPAGEVRSRIERLAEGSGSAVVVRGREEMVEDRLLELGIERTEADVVAIAGRGDVAMAVVVGGFVVSTSLTFLVARRRREIALLRAVGASRAQAAWLVVLQAAAVGTVASAGGWAVGVVTAWATARLLDARDVVPFEGGLVLLPGSAALAVALGVALTVGSSLVPAIRAFRLPPVAALADALPRPRVRVGWRCAIATASMVAAGLLIALRRPDHVFEREWHALVLVLGLAGLLALLPALVRGVAAVAASRRRDGWRRPVRRLATLGLAGASGRAANSVAPVVVGVAVVVFDLIGSSSIRADLQRDTAEAYASIDADYVVRVGSPLPDGVVDRLDALPETAAAAGARGGSVLIDGDEVSLVGTRPAPAQEIFDIEVFEGDLAGLKPTDVAVHHQLAERMGLGLGDAVTVEFFHGGTTTLEVAAVYEQGGLWWASGLLVVPEVISEHLPGYLGHTEAWIALADGVSPAAAEAAFETVLRRHPDSEAVPVAETVRHVGAWASRRSEMEIALLALTVLVAVTGAANGTLLGALDRRREHALLRAVGASRRQLGASLCGEMVLAGAIAVGAAAGLAAVAAHTLLAADPEIGVHRTPVAGTAAAVVVALVIVVLSSLWPARWAARRPVVDGLTDEGAALG